MFESFKLLWVVLGGILGAVSAGLFVAFWFTQKHKQAVAQAQSIHQQDVMALAKLPLYAEQINKLEAENQQLIEKHQNLNEEKVRAETLLNEAKALENRMTETFENLSHKILTARKSEFDDETVKANDQQKKSIEALIKPLAELIEKGGKKVTELEEDNLQTRVSLNEAIKGVVKRTEELHNTNTRLASALSNSKGRGDWGELELIRLLEVSGLVEGIHYEKQETEGHSRPDIKIYLSNGRFLYIDAKTIMVNLERLAAADQNDSSEEQIQERKRHAKALEEEIKKLSLKSYEDLIKGSVDFVVLYVPRVSMLQVALEEKPNLMEASFRRKIILASPLNLMAILKTVAYGWQQEKLSRNAEEIQALAVELHKRSATFLEKFQKIGSRLELTLSAYEEATTSFQGRMGFIPQMKKMEDLGARSKKALPEGLVAEEPEYSVTS